MIDLIVNSATTGAAVVAGLKALAMFEARKNGNGHKNGFSLTDHDNLILVKAGLDELHNDLNEIKILLRK